MADGTAVPFHTYHLGTCAAIEQGKAVGLDVQELEHAECVLRKIVAKLALAAAIAPGACDAGQLRVVIEEGRAVGLSVQELEDAERILQQIVAQQALAAARSPGCRDAKHLRTAIDEGKAVGLAVEELEHAERVLQQVAKLGGRGVRVGGGSGW